jgi:hypothetical protein
MAELPSEKLSPVDQAASNKRQKKISPLCTHAREQIMQMRRNYFQEVSHLAVKHQRLSQPSDLASVWIDEHVGFMASGV